MVKFLAIFNIFAGTCSILGLIYIYLKRRGSRVFNYIAAVCFSICLVISVYILFIPFTLFEENVRKKVSYYSRIERDKRNNILIQRGEFSIKNGGPIAIEFYEPCEEPPKVEVVNIYGHKEYYIPYIEKVTEHQAIFKRRISPYASHKFLWIAKGKPLHQE